MTDLFDTDLALRLADLKIEPNVTVAVCANAYTAAVYTQRDDDWALRCRGELGKQCEGPLKDLARLQRLYWEHSDGSPVLTDAVKKISVAELNKFLKARANILHGRYGHPSDKELTLVAAAAGYRCQFAGCGESLIETAAPHSRGRYGYFAHIVAASCFGPRGHPADSEHLARDPSNIMLLCGKHHTLIDRVAPDYYTVGKLRAMRASSLARVRALLDRLSSPPARAIHLIGSIEGQLGTLDQSERDDAMWALGLTSGEPDLQLGTPALRLAQVHTDAFWATTLAGLRDDIVRIHQTTSLPSSAPAVFFGLHATSMLVLFGRILGNASAVHVQQLHRDQLPGMRWTWPDLSGQGAPEPTFQITAEAPAPDVREATLVIGLTAKVPDSDLPASAVGPGAGLYRIDTDDPDYKIIRSTDTRDAVARLFDQAIKTLVDNWRVDLVHLVMVAPVSACVALGQKLQARHHPDVVSYERAPTHTEPRGPFMPVIRIGSTHVTHVSSGRSCSLQAESSGLTV